MGRLNSTKFFAGLFLVACLSGYAGDFKPEEYTEIEAATLKASPDNYKNKDICYKSVYRGYRTNFPAYVESCGLKSGKYYELNIFPMDVPVMGKIKGFLESKITDLKNGMKVKVYGKLKKFNVPPAHKAMPKYYLDLEEIEILGKDDKVNVPDDEDDGDRKPRRDRPQRN